MTNGFVKFVRSEQTRELQKHPKAFTLLSVIAYRARRTNMFNVQNLKSGEALIGDHKSYGMSEQEYRTSKAKLEQWGLARFKGTPRGTIAMLTDNNIYDINLEGEERTEQRPGQRTNNEQSNGQATTNKKVKKVKKVNKYSQKSNELSKLLLDLILERKPDFKKPNLQVWARHIDLMICKDKRKPDRIAEVIRWCQADNGNGSWQGWQNNILSTKKLREKFDKLELSIGNQNGDSSKNRGHSEPVVAFIR